MPSRSRPRSTCRWNTRWNSSRTTSWWKSPPRASAFASATCPRTSASALRAAHKRCCAKGARKPHGFIALTVKGRICGLCLLWRAVQACGRHGKGTAAATACNCLLLQLQQQLAQALPGRCALLRIERQGRSEEHTSELQSRQYLVCRLLLEKKKKKKALYRAGFMPTLCDAP